MTRHVLDRPRPSAAPASATETRKFLAEGPRDGSHPATTALIRRHRPTGPERLMAFLRIARLGVGKT